MENRIEEKIKIKNFIYDENILILSLDKLESSMEDRVLVEAVCETVDNEEEDYLEEIKNSLEDETKEADSRAIKSERKNYLEKVKENIKKKRYQKLFDDAISLMRNICEKKVAKYLTTSKWLQEQLTLKQLFDGEGFNLNKEEFENAVKIEGFSLEGEWEKPIAKLSNFDIKLKILKRFLGNLSLRNLVKLFNGKKLPLNEFDIENNNIPEIEIFDYRMNGNFDLFYKDYKDIENENTPEDLENYKKLNKYIYYINDIHNYNYITGVNSKGIILKKQEKKYYQYQTDFETGEIELKYFKADQVDYLGNNKYLIEKDKELNMYDIFSSSYMDLDTEITKEITDEDILDKNSIRIKNKVIYIKSTKNKFKILKEIEAYNQKENKKSYFLQDSQKRKYLLLYKKAYILKKVIIDLDFVYIIGKMIKENYTEIYGYDIYGRKITFRAKNLLDLKEFNETSKDKREEAIFEKGIVKDKNLVIFAEGMVEKNKPKFLEVLKISVKENNPRFKVNKGYEDKLVVKNKTVYIIFYNKGYTVLNFFNHERKNSKSYHKYKIDKVCIRGKNSNAPYVTSHVYIREYIYSDTQKEEKYYYMEKQLSTNDLYDISIYLSKGDIPEPEREFKDKVSYEQAIKTGINDEKLLKDVLSLKPKNIKFPIIKRK